MRILIIRHGDPHYPTDSLTDQGKMEAEALSEKLIKENIKAFYCSPLGRARQTAQYTLDKYGKEAEICDWLAEFDEVDPADRPDRQDILWDILPQIWKNNPDYFDAKKWSDTLYTKGTAFGEYYDRTVGAFDEVLKKHGYVRDGVLYRAEKPNHDTIAFFCHFGLGSVLVSYLLGISPVILWHNSVMQTSSVTEFVTEERREGEANFRMTCLGDISHLYAKGITPGFTARFVECYTDEGRHD